MCWACAILTDQGLLIQTNVGSFIICSRSHNPAGPHTDRDIAMHNYVPNLFLTLVETNSFLVFAVCDFSTTGPGTFTFGSSTSRS